MPESRLGLASLPGGLVGGVIGLSPVEGLSQLPLSSVVPVPLPDPETDSVSATVESMLLACMEDPGDDVVGESLALKRALLSEVVSVEGADFRFKEDGGLYE